MKLVLINTLFIVLFCFCDSEIEQHNFNYDFSKPEMEIRLEKKLDEISGLTFVNENTIACINDEKGNIYWIDLASENQFKYIDFKDEGDFEGIQKVGENYYVLKSNGDLYLVESNSKSTKFNLFEKGYEFEGLTFHEKRNSLLIACKIQDSDEKDDFLWVFEFDLESKRIIKSPYLKIEKSIIHKNFRPSGIAMHPNGNLFIISGVSNRIAEFTKDLELLNVVKLPEFQFPQIEGICFSNNGTLYLSSERDFFDNGKLYSFKEI